MTDDPVQRQLLGAELWERGDPGGSARFLAGWEDGAAFCAAVCTTDLGLAFCRACPTDVAGTALDRGRAASGHCPAGVRLLAFPAPAGSRDRIAVLRVAPPPGRRAASIADRIRVAPHALRVAARSADPVDARATLAAARTLRDRARLRDWQSEQRARGADRRRAAAQALAQMIATGEELQQLYRASQRQRRQLDRNRRLVDRLARQSLRAQDEERARVAHEIHDTAAQSMVSAYRFLDAARVASGSDADQPDPRLVVASERLKTAIAEVRAVLARLLPPGLEELGLADALRTRIRSVREDGVDAEVVGDLPRLEGWVEQALYGIASEAVSNAVRHGRPGNVRIDLRSVRSRAVITVVDDGRGFDPAAVVRTEDGGLGLIGMTRQASWLGGAARITSAPGGGTRVRVSIPIDRHVRAAATGGSESGAYQDAAAGTISGATRPPGSDNGRADGSAIGADPERGGRP